MEVEELAVAKVQSMIARCPHLKPFITTSDKTPLTDGHVDVYRGLGRKNSDWRGRVSVQVKGRSRSTKRNAELAFGILRTDLQAFQVDGGVLYFYVAVDAKGKCVPYYALLSPFTIEYYLRQAPEEQESISVSFKKFPSVPEHIEQIIGLALKTKNQSPSAGFDPMLFETMRSITVYTTAGLSLDEPVTLMPGETDYALEIVTAGGMTLPMDGGLDIIPEAYVEQKTDITIGAGAVTYEQVKVRRVDKETVEVRLDDGVLLELTEAHEQRIWNVSYAAQNNLGARIKATEFLLGLVDHSGVEINGTAMPLGSTTADAQSFAQELRGHLEAVRYLRELFAFLGVDVNLIELDELDSQQHQDLRVLHRLLVEGEEWRDDAGETSRGMMKVGRWELMLIVVPGQEPNLWRYVDPLAPSAPHMFRWSSNDGTAENAIPVTAYDVIEPEFLSRVLNLRLDSIVDAYEAIADATQTMSLANHQVLALIKAADASDRRKDEFLRAADTLNEWIIVHEGETAVHLINRWQIKWRRNKLTPTNLDEIRRLRRQAVRSKGPRADEIELACLLLAGDAAEAEYAIGQMERDKLQMIQSWPIWKLWDAESSSEVVPG